MLRGGNPVCKEEGQSETILIHLCGHGYFDLKAYDEYLAGRQIKHDISADEIANSPATLDSTIPNNPL